MDKNKNLTTSLFGGRQKRMKIFKSIQFIFPTSGFEDVSCVTYFMEPLAN
jgi:hypothetical protein